MTAAVWTLIALVAVGQGVLATGLLQLRRELRTEIGSVRGEIGTLRVELGTEIDGLRREMREGFAAQAVRIDAHIDRHAG